MITARGRTGNPGPAARPSPVPASSSATAGAWATAAGQPVPASPSAARLTWATAAGQSGPGPTSGIPGAGVPAAAVPAATVPAAAAKVSRRPAGPAPKASRVLLVEDEPGLLRALFINLRARRYDVVTASTGHEALATAASRPPDAVILDLGLPDIDGTEVIVELRRWSRAPIIVLSGRASPGDKIGALDVGADDYVTKPFSMAELLARLRAVLRRDDPGPAGVTEAVVGHCVIDLVTHTVTRHPGPATGTGPGMEAGTPDIAQAGSGEAVRLTPTEWRILENLVHHPGQLVGSRQLLIDIWGPGYEPHTNYLRFHMARLRRKLEDDPARPRHLLTEPGMGYRYQP
jgi:two-component system KDP operon response regulator KdpE